MPLDLRTAQIVAVAAAGGAALALLLVLVSLGKLRRMRRAYVALQVGRDGEQLLSAVGRQATTSDALRAEVSAARAEVAALRADIADGLRHVAVVRYDAFGDMGGRLSFSAALLDDAGNGLVITSINGRSETRTYAKGVAGGTSEQPLSPEEQQAIGTATRSPGGRQPLSLDPQRGRSRRSAQRAAAGA
ncbi:MAG: DUF4446 family protein [Actinomycetota bacterium]|nr:DUF4446 family protein [Actinomycetota bacterium]